MDCLNEVDDMKSGVFRDVVAKLSYQGRHGKCADHIQPQIIQDHYKTNVGGGLLPHFYRFMSGVLRGCVARRPRPLEVEPAQVTGHIQHFADEVQARAFQ